VKHLRQVDMIDQSEAATEEVIEEDTEAVVTEVAM
jgi:hypothetical protein